MKRKLAMAALAIMALILVCLLGNAFFGTDQRITLLLLFFIIVVPVVIYAFIMFFRLSKKDDGDGRED